MVVTSSARVKTVSIIGLLIIAVRSFNADPAHDLVSKHLFDDVVDLCDGDDFQVGPGLHTDGVELFLHRATMGESGEDGEFKARVAAAARLGLLVGAFHFAHQEQKAAKTSGPPIRDGHLQQAGFFVSDVQKRLQSLGKDCPKKVLLFFDVELYGEVKDKKTNKVIKPADKIIDPIAAARAIDEIKRLTGKYPGLYVNHDYACDHFRLAGLNSKAAATFRNCFIWTSKYNCEPPSTPGGLALPEWSFWQYIEADRGGQRYTEHPELRASAGGYPADISYSRISRGPELRAWFDAHAWDLVLHGKPELSERGQLKLNKNTRARRRRNA